MKVACLIDSLGSGGAQRQMTWLVRALVEKQHDVRLLTYFQDFQHFLPDIRKLGIEPESVAARSKWERFWKVRRALRHPRPDCLISFLNTPNLLAIGSSVGLPRIPVIVSERSLDVQGKTRANWIRFQAFRWADRVVTNSRAQAQFIAEHFSFLNRKTVVIRNCVDFDRFHPSPLSREASEFRIVVGASVIPVKNTHRFIEGVRLANQRSQRPITVDWFGNNLFRDGQPTPQSAFYLRAQELVQAAGLDQHFRFFDPVTDFDRRLHDYDAVCLPSVYEGCPNLICEAMAAGKPVLASDISDLQEIVGSRDFLFNPLSESSMAEKILAMSALTADQRQELGNRLHLRARELFSAERFAESYDRLLQEVVGKSATRGQEQVSP